MDNFDLDFDDYSESNTNNNMIASQKIEENSKDKYKATTVTKGFFNEETEH